VACAGALVAARPRAWCGRAHELSRRAHGRRGTAARLAWRGVFVRACARSGRRGERARVASGARGRACGAGRAREEDGRCWSGVRAGSG